MEGVEGAGAEGEGREPVDPVEARRKAEELMRRAREKREREEKELVGVEVAGGCGYGRVQESEGSVGQGVHYGTGKVVGAWAMAATWEGSSALLGDWRCVEVGVGCATAVRHERGAHIPGGRGFGGILCAMQTHLRGVKDIMATLLPLDSLQERQRELERIRAGKEMQKVLGVQRCRRCATDNQLL